MERKSCYYEVGIQVSISEPKQLKAMITKLPTNLLVLGLKGKVPSKTLSKPRLIEIQLGVLRLCDLDELKEYPIVSFRIRGILDPDWINGLHAISTIIRSANYDSEHETSSN